MSPSTPNNDDRPQATQQHNVVELTFTSTIEYDDPFNEVRLDAIFTDPDGTDRRVPAFWAGGDRWKVRYASPQVGRHTYHTQCSDPDNDGLHGATGDVEIIPYAGNNPLYLNGPPQIADDRRHFQYADGTPFFWLGDTWWMGLCSRLHWPDEFKTLVADRIDKGFTVIQIVAGLYPDMPAFDQRGANEAGFPWEDDYARIRPEYFDAADRRLQYLVESGLTPCIVGAWGYFIRWMGPEKLKQHWRYLVARYGAMPVIWCVAGEANLPWYLVEDFPYDDREQVSQWTEVARYLRDIDPFHRPMSIHPTGLGGLSARRAIDDEALLDFDMLQTGHGRREVLKPTIDTVRWSYHHEPTMPVLNSEVAYEMLNDSIPADIQRLMFWTCMLSGACGHTYGANGIWQVNRKDQPHGPSPHGGNYGTLPWDEAMDLPGSAQIALAKDLLTNYPWHRFQPHPEWAAFHDRPLLSFEPCKWIWFPEGNPAEDAAAGTCYFRKSFNIPPDTEITEAALRVSADDQFVAHINGRRIGSHADWHTGRQFSDIAPALTEGENVIAIQATNSPTDLPANPAALIARLQVEFADAASTDIVSDETWRCSRQSQPAWTEIGFDDSEWQTAMVLGAHGCDPWGAIEGTPDYEVPYAAGIPGRIRVIYVPRKRPVLVNDLDPDTDHRATYFDPLNGGTVDLGRIPVGPTGASLCKPPGGHEPDWVLIVESR